MTFVSWEFAMFLPLMLAGLWIIPTRALRQGWILGASVVFYGWHSPWQLGVLATPALIDYACALRIESSDAPRTRRAWLRLSLVTNLGLLAWFKYADFFVETFAGLLGETHVPLGIVLPVGISFFIFKTLSYTIDVYRGEIRACASLWKYAMFVSYFPELVAGPIVRASVFLPQMERPLRWSPDRTAAGLHLVLLGLTKKVIVADRLATFADPVFADPAAWSPLTVALGVVAYSLQIYCDFSGYSDMAIGFSKVIGFDLPENFNMPYLATSITEFWRRWHITLSQWLRDYLYIPLGGNRRGVRRTYVNLMVTMLLGGLWHGASWSFVFWGFLHGAGLAVHKAWSAHPRWRLPGGAIAAWTATYAFVCLGWVFFRAGDFETAMLVLRKVAGLAPGGIRWVHTPLLMLIPLVAAAHAIGTLQARGTLSMPRLVTAPVVRTATYTAWVVGVFLFAAMRRTPFIYFQF